MVKIITPTQKNIHKQKSICHLSSVHPLSDVRIFYKECVSLSKAGYDVTLVIPNEQDEIRNTIRIKAIKKRTQGRIIRMTLTVLDVLRKALKQHADIYHFHDPELIPIALLLKVLRKTKVIYDVHEDYPRAMLSRYYLSPVVRRLTSFAFEKFEEFAIQYFDAVISATPVITKRFEKLNKNTFTVQNFPILDELYTGETVSWEKRSNHLVYIGAINILRGIKEMVGATALASKKTAIELNLAGNFSPQSLQNEISSMDGWQKTNYLGYLSRGKVTQLLGQVKIGLVLIHPEPQYQVSYPVKLFEYMSAGIPVIASDFPLWRKIVDGAACGLLVDPKKTDEIAKAILFLFENPDRAETMGKQGRRAVKEKYNWDLEKIKLIELYDILLSEKKK
jgi:glycosyltransferase involved in cell wall biosynthesis